MKTVLFKKVLVVFLPGMISAPLINVQVASWNFNNILTGTGSATSFAGMHHRAAQSHPAEHLTEEKSALK